MGSNTGIQTGRTGLNNRCRPYGRNGLGLNRILSEAINIKPVNTGLPIKKDCDFNSEEINKNEYSGENFSGIVYRTIRLGAVVFVRDILAICNSVLFIRVQMYIIY